MTRTKGNVGHTYSSIGSVCVIFVISLDYLFPFPYFKQTPLRSMMIRCRVIPCEHEISFLKSVEQHGVLFDYSGVF
jgi:hypothetical protein